MIKYQTENLEEIPIWGDDSINKRSNLLCKKALEIWKI